MLRKERADNLLLRTYGRTDGSICRGCVYAHNVQNRVIYRICFFFRIKPSLSHKRLSIQFFRRGVHHNNHHRAPAPLSALLRHCLYWLLFYGRANLSQSWCVAAAPWWWWWWGDGLNNLNARK